MEDFGKYKKQLIVFGCIILIIIIAVVWATLSINHENNDLHINISEEKNEKNDEDDTTCDKTFLGLMMTVIDENNTFHVHSIDNGLEYVMEVDHLTTYCNKYGKSVTAAGIKPGDIVEIGYNNDKEEIICINISDDYWEIKGIRNYELDLSKKIFKYDSKKYKISEEHSVFSGDKIVNLSNIKDGDMITVRGIEKTVWSIVINEAHGQLSLANADIFDNGKITIDNDKTYNIENGMMLDILEGTHEVVLINEDKRAKSTIEISRDNTTVLDISKLEVTQNNFTMVSFDISPASARLYIDGTPCTIRDDIKMYYGNYEIIVESTGYNAFRGTLVVDSNNESMTVKLSKEIEETEEPEDEGGRNDSTKDSSDIDKEENEVATDEENESEDTSEQETNSNFSENNNSDESQLEDDNNDEVIKNDMNEDDNDIEENT